MLARAECNKSLSSYLLTSLFSPRNSSSFAHVRHYNNNTYKAVKQPINNRDYTKTLYKTKAKTKEEQEDTKKKAPPPNPFLRKKPLFTPKKKRHTTLPEPYKHTQNGFVKRKEQVRKLIRWDLVAKHRREKEEFKIQKNSVFTSETLPAILSPQQIADLITSQKKMSRSLMVFKEARKAGLAKNGQVYAALVSKLCLFDQPLHALNMIEELESLQEVHSELPAKAFVKAVGEQRAVEMVQLARKMMVKENILPLCSTYVTFAKILTTANRPYEALDIVQEMEASNVKLDQHSYQALAILFRQIKQYDKVRIALNKMAFSYQITHTRIETLKPDGEPIAESDKLDKASYREESAKLGTEKNTIDNNDNSNDKKETEKDNNITSTNNKAENDTNPTSGNNNSQTNIPNINITETNTTEESTTNISKAEESINNNITADNIQTKTPPQTENTGQKEQTKTEKEQTEKTQNNAKEARKHKPYLLLKTYELDKLVMKNTLKEKQDEILKKV